MHRTLAFAIALSTLTVGAVRAQNPTAESSTDPTNREILVRFQDQIRPLTRLAIAARARGTIVKTNPVLGYEKILVPEGVSVPDALARIKREPGILWAERNGTYRATSCIGCPQDPFLLPPEDQLPTGENQWGIFLSGIPWLWRHGGGGSASVIIAIVDSGIDDFGSPHPDLAANVLGTGHDFVDDDANPTDVGVAAKLYGHGTHVAGIAAAAANAIGIAGVAYASKIMVVRVLNCTAGSDCPGTFDNIADGIQYAADNGARVINLSLAGMTPSSTVRSAIQYAIGKGAIVVAASGNDSADEVGYPARYDEVIAVGAADSLDNVASFSNAGPELDVVAPGVGIWSTFPGPTYRRFNGTSMATPFVSGIAAVVAARQPNIKQQEMEAYLRDHAVPLVGENAARDGFGLVGYQPLEDWSDAPPPYSAAVHKNYLWEWLGRDASAENSIADPFDTDFRGNIGAPHNVDGYDDGAFPHSFMKLPFLPPHVGPGTSVDVNLQVSRFDGPRYGAGPGKQLHLDVWFDWDSDGVFEPAAAERGVADHVENPATWGGNVKIVTLPITPIDEHILGNPLVVRTRLSYGSSPGDADSPAAYGEVEDHQMINFVEDFDIGVRSHVPGVYTVMTSWEVVPDPSAQCANRGVHHFGRSRHPAPPGDPCNGIIESINVMGTPTMNWQEYAHATLSFWYCHQFGPCDPPSGLDDMCRVRIDTSGVKHDIGPIPMGIGTLMIDLSPFCGSEAVIIEFVEHTDLPGTVAIDDIVITAFDPEPSPGVSNLALSRAAGSKTVDLTWTAPAENVFFPTPPGDPQANLYDIRRARTPIVTELDWDHAERFEPREVLSAGPPVPGVPGSGEAISFRVPSAFEPYFVALRVGDEVVNLSGNSNSPGDTPSATIGVDVVSLADTVGAPGDTVAMLFRVSNTGNTPDTYAITGFDTGGWTLLGVPTSRNVPASSSSVFLLPVIVPVSASTGDRDTVTLVATSLADGTTSDADAGEIEVTGAVDVPPLVAGMPGLHDVGPLPFRGALGFGLRLLAAEQTSLKIYDVSGRLVRELADRTLQPGVHRFSWNGRDRSGRQVASGFYFLRAQTPSFLETRRILRVR